MDRQNEVVKLVVKLDALDIVEYAEQVPLDRVWVARLSKDLQKSGIGHEEEAWKQKTFPFQITAQKSTAGLV